MNHRLTKQTVASSEPKDRIYDVRDGDLPGFLLRVEPSGRKTFYLRGRLTNPDRTRGPRRYYHIGDARHWTPAQARNEAQRLAGMLAAGEDPDEAKRREKVGTIGALVEGEYLRNVLEHRRSGMATRDRLQRCFGFLWDRPLDDSTIPNAVRNWQTQRLKEGRAASTINRDVTTLHTVLSYAVERGYLSTHPLAKVKPLSEPKDNRIRYLAPEEEARLYDALDAREERIRQDRDNANKWRKERGYRLLPDLRAAAYADRLKPVVIVALNTGLRRGELFSLKWGDIDFERRMVTVRAAVAKTHTTRHVPLNEDALEALRGWKAQGKGRGLVFPGKDGGQLHDVNTAWRNLMKAAEIQEFRFHDMRHDFASKLVMAGVDLNTVRELLGHRDLKMTLKYAHLAPEKLNDAVARITRSNVVSFGDGQHEAGSD